MFKVRLPCLLHVLSLPALLYAQTHPVAAQTAAQAPAHQSSPSPSEVIKFGKIQGVVTYYFNLDIGSKVDLWSHVFLISGAVDIPVDKVAYKVKDELQIASSAERILGVAEERNGHPYPRLGLFFPIFEERRVDGNGSFRFDDLPPGNYTVVIASDHSNGSGIRDHFNRWQCIPVEVKPGRTADASNYFAPSDH